MFDHFGGFRSTGITVAENQEDFISVFRFWLEKELHTFVNYFYEMNIY